MIFFPVCNFNFNFNFIEDNPQLPTRFQDGQIGDDKVHRLVQTDGHAAVRSSPSLLQRGGQQVAPLVKLRERHLPLLRHADHRHVIRMVPRLALEDLVQEALLLVVHGEAGEGLVNSELQHGNTRPVTVREFRHGRSNEEEEEMMRLAVAI